MLLRILHRLEDAVLALLLIAMIGFAVLQIVLRNLFDSGLSWGDDLVRTSVLWIALVGSMVAARRGQHIRIDALTRLLPVRMGAAADRLADLCAGALCVVLAWLGGEFVALEYTDGIVAFAGVPNWLTVLVIPLAFTVMGLRYLGQALLGRPRLDHERPVPRDEPVDEAGS
ncbi:MAG TPA: TRAP transporter small permease [Pseudomonadales bacterium]|nr:TRAP transporter small permease [Pseudomonadales bacterium]